MALGEIGGWLLEVGAELPVVALGGRGGSP